MSTRPPMLTLRPEEQRDFEEWARFAELLGDLGPKEREVLYRLGKSLLETQSMESELDKYGSEWWRTNRRKLLVRLLMEEVPA